METRIRFDALKVGDVIKWCGINQTVIGFEYKSGTRMNLLYGDKITPNRIHGHNLSTITSYI